MRKRDSSKTRVQPVFRALYERDASGRSWLGELMRLGGRGTPPGDPGLLVKGNPHFEFLAPPPRDFLRWLVENPSCLQMPKYRTSEGSEKKRAALFRGDATVKAAALAAIDDPKISHQQKWWCLEGTTSVDCALITHRLVLFIEGKRTEIGPSEKISWYPHRNQVLRNLDCARWLGGKRGLDYFTLLVLEDLDDEERVSRAKDVESSETVRLSLPHLTEEGRREVMKHYLGFTTWRAIVERFGLDPKLLK